MMVSSPYCDSDKLADFTWSQFGKLSGGTRVVQAICDFVHAKIRFNYPDASPTRCASDSMHEGVGVCRDFAHLAIALCRCMNIPARYSTGHLRDIGVPIDINPMDFSAWFEVFLDGRWYTMDARHNHPRIDRIVMGRVANGRYWHDPSVAPTAASPRIPAVQIVPGIAGRPPNWAFQYLPDWAALDAKGRLRDDVPLEGLRARAIFEPPRKRAGEPCPRSGYVVSA